MIQAGEDISANMLEPNFPRILSKLEKRVSGAKSIIKKGVTFSSSSDYLNTTQQPWGVFRAKLMEAISKGDGALDDQQLLEVAQEIVERNETNEMKARRVKRIKAHSILSLHDGSSLRDDIMLEETYQRFTRDGVFGLTEFQKVAKDLKLDITDADLQRVFEVLDVDGNGTLDMDEFKIGVKKHVFLRNLVSIHDLVDSGGADFTVSKTYDWKKTTNDNYQVDSKNYCGDFKDIRETRDYSYHVNYTEERQFWQDHFIHTVVIRSARQPEPWIVYTCGPMGAGKGYTLSWMSEHGYFPLENIVHIDPDYFKQIMPEWGGYVKRDAKMAGTLCHRESCYLQEIAQEVAMKHSQNVWVDGSLRDGKWYSSVFKKNREMYPKYKIAIFYIYASEKVVRQRIEERRKRTGRGVPEELIVDSLRSPDHSLRLLTPYTDLVCRIKNDDSPVLEAVETVDISGSWDLIGMRFAGNLKNYSKKDITVGFHFQQQTMYMNQTSLSQENVEIIRENNAIQSIRIKESAFNSMDLQKLWQLIMDCGLADTLKISPLGKVKKEFEGINFMFAQAGRLALEGIEDSGRDSGVGEDLIPLASSSYGWCYPIPGLQMLAKGMFCIAKGPLADLLLTGGFIYFDSQSKFCGINSVSETQSRHPIKFSRAFQLDKSLNIALNSANRWEPVVRNQPSRYYTWLPPDDKLLLSSTVKQNKIENNTCRGFFAYIFHDKDKATLQERERDCLLQITIPK